jgi:hypothetical protein
VPPRQFGVRRRDASQHSKQASKGKIETTKSGRSWRGGPIAALLLTAKSSSFAPAFNFSRSHTDCAPLEIAFVPHRLRCKRMPEQVGAFLSLIRLPKERRKFSLPLGRDGFHKVVLAQFSIDLLPAWLRIGRDRWQLANRAHCSPSHGSRLPSAARSHRRAGIH